MTPQNNPNATTSRNQPIADEPDKREESNSDSDDSYAKSSLFNDLGIGTISVCAVYLFSFACILSFAYKAGKYTEYVIPFYLLEINIASLSIIFSALSIASLSAITVIKLNLPPKKHIKDRTKKITDFSTAVTTIAVAGYFAVTINYMSKQGKIPLEAGYIFFVYSAMVVLYFMKKTSKLAYNLVSSGFIVTLLITTFYIGIGIARIEDKLLVTINEETFCFTTIYGDNMVLSGYNRGISKFNGRMMMIKQSERDDLVFTRHKI